MCWFGTLLQEAIIPCFLVTVFKIKLMFMFVERNQGIYQSSFVVLMLHIVYSIVAVLQVWYCVNLLIGPNKNNSWFQVSQPCFIWVGRSEKHFI